MLAYSGPAARYDGPAACGNAVYRRGEVTYRAPAPVLGAAIQRDAAGDEWVVVVTHDQVPRRNGNTIGDTATVWRRDARLLDQNSAVYDAQTNRKGWRKTGVVSLPQGLQVGPWFFNGDGTEAAAVRVVDDSHNFSAREEDPDCYRNSSAWPVGYCVPGLAGLGAAYPTGTQPVKESRLYTLSVPLPGSGSQVGVRSARDSVDAAVMAVDYDDDVQLVLREENIATDRGYLDDPDPASADDFRWLAINGTPLTTAATLGCSVGSAPCRWNRSGGFTRSFGGFVALLGDLARKPTERVAYHVFYIDLRTGTYAFSRREGDRTDYSLVHDGGAPVPLGNESGLGAQSFYSYAGSRYGYEGDYRNLDTNGSANKLVKRAGTVKPFGVWPKVNPLLGRYEMEPRSLFSISPPPEFGIDVAVDRSVLASGRLPGGETFNYHSVVDLERALGIGLARSTLLPIGVR